MKSTHFQTGEVVDHQPLFFRVMASYRTLTSYLWAQPTEPGTGTVARAVYGKRMSNTAGLFQEFAAALQFPYYFGNNWIALRECLTDLEWLPAKEYELIIFDFPQVLQNDPDGLGILLRILGEVSLEWGTPISIGEYWDRPARSFKVLFHATPGWEDAVVQLCNPFGLSLIPLDLVPVEGTE